MTHGYSWAMIFDQGKKKRCGTVKPQIYNTFITRRILISYCIFSIKCRTNTQARLMVQSQEAISLYRESYQIKVYNKQRSFLILTVWCMYIIHTIYLVHLQSWFT